MQVLIMAAGMGSRLKELTVQRPKPLLILNGKPLLERNLEKLLSIVEISQIIIVSGYKGEMVREFLHKNFNEQLTQKKIVLVHNEDYKEGSVLTILKAKHLITGEFMLLNADHIFNTKAYKEAAQYTDSINIATFRNRTPGDDDFLLKVFSSDEKKFSWRDDLDVAYTGLTVIGKDQVATYFEMAQKMVLEMGRHIVPEFLMKPLYENGATIRELDFSCHKFIEIDDQNDLKEAESKIILIDADNL